ncbi:hypothetical protein B0H19DRAFT_1152399 [Mycena capillaripes]|nr:hypothetical protein B0H19DRAFT_1152399 [Mycena capillaripes]
MCRLPTAAWLSTAFSPVVMHLRTMPRCFWDVRGWCRVPRRTRRCVTHSKRLLIRARLVRCSLPRAHSAVVPFSSIRVHAATGHTLRQVHRLDVE